MLGIFLDCNFFLQAYSGKNFKKPSNFHNYEKKTISKLNARGRKLKNGTTQANMTLCFPRLKSEVPTHMFLSFQVNLLPYYFQSSYFFELTQ